MIDINKIPEEDKTPLVTELLHTIQSLLDGAQQLRDEVARLKNQKGKPRIPPSRLEKTPNKVTKNNNKEKRPGSEKRSKTKDLHIHKTIQIFLVLLLVASVGLSYSNHYEALYVKNVFFPASPSEAQKTLVKNIHESDVIFKHWGPKMYLKEEICSPAYGFLRISCSEGKPGCPANSKLR